jgi:RimJ/RimL family protein N-acetyltransferase
LVLRPFTQDDVAELAPIHAEPTFWWYPLRGPMSEDDTRAFLTRVLDRYRSDGYGVEALLDRSSGVLIGWAGLAVPHFLPDVLPAVEVGWRLSKAFWGRGLATEAGEAAVRFGFAERDLERIVSIYEPENVASGRVMEHLGFTLCQAGLTTVMGEQVDVTELTREQWEKQHRGG